MFGKKNKKQGKCGEVLDCAHASTSCVFPPGWDLKVRSTRCHRHQCARGLSELVFPTGQQQQVSSGLSFSLLGAMVTAGNESTVLLIIKGLFASLLLSVKFPGFLHKQLTDPTEHQCTNIHQRCASCPNSEEDLTDEETPSHFKPLTLERRDQAKFRGMNMIQSWKTVV